MALASLYFSSALCAAFVSPPLMDYIINDLEATTEQVGQSATGRLPPPLLTSVLVSVSVRSIHDPMLESFIHRC